MFNIFKDTIAKDLSKIADYFNGVADAGTIFKDKRALAVNRIKNAVLNGDIGGGGVTPEIEAEIENAQWKSETSTPLFSETVTTVAGDPYISAVLAYSEPITADTLKVTFDGVEYTCPKFSGGFGTVYGGVGQSGPDFTEFPFAIISSEGENILYTENEGTHAVSAFTENITYTDAFKNGVKANATMVVNFTVSGEGAYTADKTNDDIINAFYKGTLIVGFILGQNTYAGIPFNIERVNTLGQTPEISFNAIVVASNTPHLYRISSYSDETGDGYEITDISLATQ